jgi:hypothetical protein
MAETLNLLREEHHFTVIALNLEEYVQTCCFLKGSLSLAILNLEGKKTQSFFSFEVSNVITVAK